MLLAEMTIGRGGRGNASSSYVALSKSKAWGSLGFISVVAPFLIMTFYAVVTGWTLHYAVLSFTGNLFAHHQFKERFVAFTSGYMPII